MNQVAEALEMGTPPGPGVHEGVPFEEYVEWPFLNQSGAKLVLRSPAHYYQAEDEETRSKVRGTVCHAALWEPARFHEQYAIGPDVKLNTKVGKEEWEAFVAANPGKFHVRGADGAAMHGVRNAVWTHRNARKLLAAEGPTELCIVWDDPEIGVRCKARIDKYAPGLAMAADLKTTTDARPDPFAKQVANLRYHLQGAFTLHGLAAVGLPCDDFYLIAAETDAPYGVMVYRLDDAAIEAGRGLMLQAMAEWKKCMETGRWPGYDDVAYELALPKWA